MTYRFDELWQNISATGDRPLSSDSRRELCEKLDAEFRAQRERFPVDWRILGVQEGMSGLIIGCGTGIEALEMQQQFSGRLKLQCIDHAADMIAWAMVHHAKSPLMHGTTFSNLDVFALDAGGDESVFDFAEMRRVVGGWPRAEELFRHLPCLVRPGGLVIIDDSDIDGFRAQTAEPEVELICETIQQGCEANGGIRYSGRAIALALHKTGCTGISIASRSASSPVNPAQFFPRFIGIIPQAQEDYRRRAMTLAVSLANRTESIILQRSWVTVTARLPV